MRVDNQGKNMSLIDSIRGLSEESANEFLRSRTLPKLTITVGLPDVENSWVKRKLMQSKQSTEKQNAFEDFSWSIPDLGAGGEW